MLNKRSNSYKWMVLAISFMLMLTFSISLQSLPPIFDKIQKDISFSMSESFSTLLTYRLVTGIGVTALVVLAPLLVTMFFDQENMGIAIGPWAFGILLDKTGGNFSFGFIILALVSLGSILALRGLKTETS